MPQVSLKQMAETMAVAPTLVSFPTDTVPALAARPEQAELIYAAKRRPPEKPLILMGASLSALLPYVSGDAAALAVWQQLTAQHWPGQLLREDLTYHTCYDRPDDLIAQVERFQARLNQDPLALSQRLWVTTRLDPEIEKLRFPTQTGFMLLVVSSSV